jgi:hypothetical protein
LKIVSIGATKGKYVPGEAVHRRPIIRSVKAAGVQVDEIWSFGLRVVRPLTPHRMPINLSCAGPNARETDACCRIIGRHGERHGIGMNLPAACRNFDFIEVGFAVRCGVGVNAQALHTRHAIGRSILPKDMRQTKAWGFAFETKKLSAQTIRHREGGR